MGRGTVVATVLAALLAGSGVGIGLHAWRPDPFVRASGTDQSGGPASPTASTTSPSAGRTRQPSPTPSASPNASSSSSSSSGPTAGQTDDGPAFTRLALLQPPEFVDNGWEVARVTYGYPSLPDQPITPCASIGADDTDVEKGYAATYASNHTVAQELVARYRDTGAAKKAYSRMLNAITNCDNPAIATSDKVVKITSFAWSPTAPGVSAIRWWNTRGSSDSAVKGVIGVVRSGDRIALVNLSSGYSNPDGTHESGTTDIDALLTQAGRRLV